MVKRILKYLGMVAKGYECIWVGYNTIIIVVVALSTPLFILLLLFASTCFSKSIHVFGLYTHIVATGIQTNAEEAFPNTVSSTILRAIWKDCLTVTYEKLSMISHPLLYFF